MDFSRFYFVIINLWTIPLIAECQDHPPTLTKPGSVRMGDDASFTCSYDFTVYVPDLLGRKSLMAFFNDLTWFRNDVELGKVNGAGRTSFELVKGIQDDSVVITFAPMPQGTMNGIVSTLRIKSVNCSDAGTYVCQVNGQNYKSEPRKDSSTTTLNVTKGPDRPSFPTYNPNPIIVNTTTTFTCQGNVGLPARSLKMYLQKRGFKKTPLVARPQTTWISSDGCTYMGRITAEAVLDPPREGDDDKVVCEITDTIRTYVDLVIEYPVTEVVMTLIVKSTRRSINRNNTVQTVYDGDDYRISCHARSKPAASYEIRYVSDSRVERTNISRHDPYRATASKGPDRRYYCVASNKLSNDHVASVSSHHVLIEVVDKPTVVTTSTTPTTTAGGGATQPVKEDDGPSTGGIIGGVIGGLAALAVIIIIVLCICKHKRRPKKYSSSSPVGSKTINNISSGSLYKDSDPDLYKSHKQPSAPSANYNTGYNRQDDYLDHIPMSTEGRSRNPVMLNETPYGYNSPYPESIASQYSHSRPV